MQIIFAKAAQKHGIEDADAGHAMENAIAVFREDAPDPSDEDDRLVFLGPARDGAMLEVMALELDSGDLLVIHTMKIRRKYRDRLESL